MDRRFLGRTGMAVTPIGFGGAEIGYQQAAQESVNRLLNEALDLGMNVIDTAECYPGSEELIGKAVAHRRADFFLFTKCGHDGKSFNLPNWDLRLLQQQIDRSLTRLNTDRLDLLQIHSCTLEQLRQGDILAVVKKARDAGKTRFIGYSGDSAAARWAAESGEFDTLQTSVNIADQEAIDLTLPLCASRGMGVIAKRPVANVAWKNQGQFLGGYDRVYWERVQKLKYPFLERPVGEAVAKALRFTLSCPGVTVAIAGTAKPGRFKENAEAVKAGPLAPAEFDAIRKRWKEVAEPDWTGQT
jgi:aryl-alcohol dehydrogenase-like predicted oxidoreductase